eukprot:comp11922_c1_seq1/m.6582 comp11922_c1_seq1/g.6582  ORF comp11922_c1_seq1/g.6582 comp11922_c1_seq1/m.6582 type:complete len:773 (-) comp11922_c1_seq1:253-2571(-)
MATAQPNLKDILQRAQRIPRTADAGVTMQPLRTGLPQIARGTAELLKRATQEVDMSLDKSVAATGMLARQNFDASTIQRTLQGVSLKTTFEPLELTGITDVQGYLQDEYSRLVSAVISEAEANAVSAFHDSYARRMQEDWRRERGTIMEELAVRSSTSKEMSITRMTMGDKELRYHEAVSKFAKKGKDAGVAPVRELIRECQTIPADIQLRKCWELLGMWAERLEKFGELKQKPSQANFIQAATYFLQKEYATILTGREMSSQELSRSALAQRFHAMEEKEWVVLFLLLRAGEGQNWKDGEWAIDLKEGCETLKAAQDPKVGKVQEVKDFCTGNRMGERKAMARFMQGQTASKLVCNILARNPNIDDYYDPDYIRTAEDYLWLVLLTLQNAPADVIRRNPSLESMTRDRETMAFYVLFFAGQFEKAISRLEGTEYFTDAVHFAMVLKALGLSTSVEPINLVQKYLRSVGFARRIPDPYLVLIYRLDVADRTSVFPALLEEYASTFTSMDELRRLLDPKQNKWAEVGEAVRPDILQSVAKRLGDKLRDRGQVATALALFDLAPDPKAGGAEAKLVTLVDNLRLMILAETGSAAPGSISNLPNDPLVLAAFNEKNAAADVTSNAYLQLRHLCLCVEILYYCHMGLVSANTSDKLDNLNHGFEKLNEPYQVVLPRPTSNDVVNNAQALRDIVSTPELDEWLLRRAVRITKELYFLKAQDPVARNSYKEYASRLFEVSGKFNLTTTAMQEIMDTFHRINAAPIQSAFTAPRAMFGQ